MSTLLRDARTAIRGLINNLGFTVVAVATLALGIGATTSIYTVVKHVLLEPLPYPEPGRLVVIQEKNPEAGFPRFSISPLNFRDYRAMSTSFSSMAARSGTSLALAGDAGSTPRLVAGRQVTADFLKVLGVPPALGRDFVAADDLPGASRVIILGDALWQELGANPDIIGADLRIEGEPTTVIGVLPDHFPPATEALVPLAHDYAESNRGAHWLLALGRLKPGITVAQARTELETIAAQLEETYPASNQGWGAIVDPLHARTVEDIRVALWMLMGAVALVLLIACANVANLTLARVAVREREMALRSALGAGRGQLVRQLLIESLVLSMVAGGLGLALATRGTVWLVSLAADDIPRSEAIGVDSGVLLFALVATLGTALLFGLVPGAPSVEDQSRGDAQRGWTRPGRLAARCAPANRLGARRSGAGAGHSGGRGPLNPQLHTAPFGRARVRSQLQSGQPG